jgi:quercetin dioxygenase-like cupin family protein
MTQVVWLPGGVRVEVRLGAGDTDGAFSLLVDEPPPGWSLPPHRHTNESETIHVVEGRFSLTIEGEEQLLLAGDTAHVPRGAVHSGGNVGAEPGRRVVVFAPAGIERWFLEAGAPSSDDEVDLGRTLALASQYGWEFPEA